MAANSRWRKHLTAMARNVASRSGGLVGWPVLSRAGDTMKKRVWGAVCHCLQAVSPVELFSNSVFPDILGGMVTRLRW
jgi:hypothetical protein